MKEEILSFHDNETRAEIIKWTNSSKDDQHLYFTSPSITDDGKYLIIISERNGHPNLYCIDRETQEITQISDSEGLLHSYTYPLGGPKGFSKASPYLDSKNHKVYWIQNDAVWVSKVNEKPVPIKVADLPKGWVTGYTTLSGDGRKFCVPCADPQAFLEKDKTQHGQLKNVPLRMIQGGYKTKIIIINTASGALETLAELPFWVTHVQFDGNNSKSILCNSEGGLASKANYSFPYWGRIWLIDENGNCSRLFDQKEGEYVNHENFNSSGHVIYHGTKKLSIHKKFLYYLYVVLNKYLNLGINHTKMQNLFSHFVGIRDKGGNILHLEEVDFPVSHAVAGNNDFYFFTDSRDGHIYGHYYNGGQLTKTIICKHDSSMRVQDAHPHPRANQAGRSVIFTSDREGSCNVYEVKPNL